MINNYLIKLSKILIICLSLISISGISSIKISDKTQEYTIEDFTDFTKEIKANANSDLIIKLKGNPTTGYSWYLQNYNEVITNFPNYLKPVNMTEVNGLYTTELYESNNNAEINSDTSEGMMTGVGGTYLFQFSPTGVAFEDIHLKFIYMRNWESESNTSNSFVDVSVDMDSNIEFTKVILEENDSDSDHEGLDSNSRNIIIDLFYLFCVFACFILG